MERILSSPFKKDRSSSGQLVDLIYRASGMFANLDPQEPLDLGDYGYVNGDTGRFLKQGNIFKEGEVAFEKVTESPADSLILLSEGVRESEK